MYLTSRNRLRFPWLRVETFNNQPVLIVSSRSALKDVAPWIKDIKYVGRGEIKGDGGEPLDTLLFYTGRCGIDREPTGKLTAESSRLLSVRSAAGPGHPATKNTARRWPPGRHMARASLRA